MKNGATRMDAREYALFDRIIHPRSVAVVGASGTPGKFGYFYMNALCTIGFDGRLFPINKNPDPILGHKTYPSLRDLPETPDLVVVTIPAKHVPAALEEALSVGIPGAVVISAGFSEDCVEGARLEKEVADIARRGIRIIGPNCFGTYSPKAGVTIIPGSGFSRKPGPVGFFAQSGGLTADLGQIAMSHGVGFSAMVSYGNGVDVNEMDMLEWFVQDDATRIIAAYIEGIRDGKRFVNLVREVATKKPVIIWKGGTSPAGSRMVMSHTGSMGGSAAVWDAVFKQTGAVQVSGLVELIDTLMAFVYLYPRAGRRIAVMGGGGALGVEASDIADMSGITLPVFPEEVQKRIKAQLPEFGNSARNPVDTGNPFTPAESLVEMMRIAAGLKDIDVICLIQLMFHSQALMRRVLGAKETPLSAYALYPKLAEGAREIRATYDKPVIGIFPQTSLSDTEEDMDLEREHRKAREAFIAAGAAFFPTVRRAVEALAKVAAYQEFQKRQVSS